MSLVLGTLEVTVLLVMEVAKREEWNPRPLVMANPMNEQEGRSNPSMNFSGNCIHHSGRVEGQARLLAVAMISTMRRR